MGDLSNSTNMKINNLFLILSTVFIALHFQVVAQQIPQTFQGRTHMMSVDEFYRLHQVGKGFSETAPPQGYIRNIAEFERMEGVLVTYLSDSPTDGYFGIPLDLISEMSKEVNVYTVVEDSNAMNQVLAKYQNASVVIEHVGFILDKADSYWSRDYGPWFIANNQKVKIVDFPYNRPRPNDDNIPAGFSVFWETEVYGMGLISTGGNYMTDGMGIAASCDLVLAENPELSKTQVQKKVNDYLGVHTYHLLDDPLDDYIEHIDCWGKFLAVDKILITQVPSTDYRYADFEAAANYFTNQNSSYGTPYKVFRVYSPNGQPYTNSLILNNKVFVPIVTGFGNQWNDEALAVYRQALPGFEIIGFEQDANTPWVSTDALHCRTHEIPDKNLVFVHHLPIHDSLPIDTREVKISAFIDAYGENKISDVTLYYQHNQKRYIGKRMELDQVKNDTGFLYHNYITGMENGDTLKYYIQVTDQSNQITYHPAMGNLEPHQFFVKVDTATTPTDISNSIYAGVKLFPNPANHQLTLVFNNVTERELTLEIFNIQGKLVQQFQIDAPQEWFRFDLPLDEIPNGMYLLSLKFSGSIIQRKFVISR